MVVEPLHWPEHIRLRTPLIERVLWFIPVIGWIGANSLECRRMRPIVEFIEAQLEARTNATIEMWGTDSRTLEIAKVLCSALREEIGWPSDHFIPDDPAEIAFWDHYDGLDCVEAIMSIEEHLGVKISDAEIENCLGNGKTLQSLVNELMKKI